MVPTPSGASGIGTLSDNGVDSFRTDLEDGGSSNSIASLLSEGVLPQQVQLPEEVPSYRDPFPVHLVCDDDEPECRICKEADEASRMISPCVCEGTLKYVHPHCLQEWILKRQVSVDSNKCEICNGAYTMEIRHVLHCNRSTLCSRASWAFYFEFGTVVMCLVSLCYIFMLSRTGGSDDGTGAQANHNFQLDEPTCIMVMCIGGAVTAFALFTMAKMFVLWKRSVSQPEIVIR